MNYDEKLLNAINEVEKSGKLREFMETEVKEQYVANCMNGGFSGWGNKVYIDINGELSITGSVSYNTSTLAAHEGKQFLLFTIPSVIDIDFTLSSDEIEDLNQYQTADLYNSLTISLDDDSLKDFPDLHAFLTPYFYVYLEEKYKNLFPDRYELLLKEHAEDYFEYYLEDFYNNIDLTKDSLEGEVKYPKTIEVGDMEF